MKMKYKHLTKPGVLKRIGRPLLTGFFECFRHDFNANGRALPPPQLSDNGYF